LRLELVDAVRVSAFRFAHRGVYRMACLRQFTACAFSDAVRSPCDDDNFAHTIP
jgi:hypothetical protein